MRNSATVKDGYRRLISRVWGVIDNDTAKRSLNQGRGGVDWLRVWPFIFLHLACIAVFWVGFSTTAAIVLVLSYALRMFAITAFYHRYFAHRSFKTGRTVQFIFAVLGTAATQRGPLWWAAHHRFHHRHADTDLDIHSPRNGFWKSHCGWFLGRDAFEAPEHLIRDFSRFPELRWLDRFDILIPIAFAGLLYGFGEWLRFAYPQLETSGMQLLVWGYFVATVLLLHATLAINSLAHRFGRRRYATADDSRNNALLALVTMGEGWHNNHHHYPSSARQGFFWYEIDLSWYLLWLLSKAGLVHELRGVPEGRRKSPGNGGHR